MGILPKHDPMLKRLLPQLRLRAWLSQPGETEERVNPVKAAVSISVNISFMDLVAWDLKRQDKSWRDIHLTAPRLESVSVMMEGAYLRHGTSVVTKQELFCGDGITMGHVYDQLLIMQRDIEQDTQRERLLWPKTYCTFEEFWPRWHDKDTSSIMTRPAEQFDHLLEPCVLPRCSSWLPRFNQHAKWVNADRFDVFKMIHQFYHHDDNMQWNSFGDRKYIDADSELRLERTDPRELRYDLLRY